MKFREATAEDKMIIKQILRYAFDSNRNRYDDLKEEKEPTFAYINMVKDYIAEENETIVAVIGVIDFSQHLRGSWVKMAGITAVACRPEFRRMAYMTKLFEYVFQQLHTQGFLVSALYPFSFNYYEKFGYGQADVIKVFTVKSSDIIQRATPNRIIREEFDETFEKCQSLYEKLSFQKEGLVKRPPAVWKNLEGWNWTRGGYQFICQDRDGNDLGYLIVRFEDKSARNPFSYLEVREIVYFDPETKQAFLNFLANHDSQRDYIKIAPYEQNYLPFFKSPRVKENLIIANSMFRIIDIHHLLPQLKYPSNIDTALTLEITDPKTQCPWNNGTLTLKVKKGKGEISDTPVPHTVKLGIKELSQILVGFYSPSDLAEIGTVSGSVEALTTLAKIFPKQEITLRDYF